MAPAPKPSSMSLHQVLDAKWQAHLALANSTLNAQVKLVPKAKITKPKKIEARNFRTLTERRKRMITEFMTTFQANPDTHGSYGSDRWITALMTHLNERKYGLLPLDIQHWLAQESFFKNFNNTYKYNSCSSSQSNSAKSESYSGSSCGNPSNDGEVEATDAPTGPSGPTAFSGFLNQPGPHQREEFPPATEDDDAIVEDIKSMEIVDESQLDGATGDVLPLAGTKREQEQDELDEDVPEAVDEETIKMEADDEIKVKTEDEGQQEHFEHEHNQEEQQQPFIPWFWPQPSISRVSFEALMEPKNLSVTNLKPDPSNPTYAPSAVTTVPLMIPANLDPSLVTDGSSFIPTNTLVITTPPGMLVSSTEYLWPSPSSPGRFTTDPAAATATRPRTVEKVKPEANEIPEDLERMEEEGGVPPEENNAPEDPLERVHEYFNLLGDFVHVLQTEGAGEYNRFAVEALFYNASVAKSLLGELRNA